MREDMNLINFVYQFVPLGAELLSSKLEMRSQVIIADFDGDGLNEIVGGYRYQHEDYIFLLKYFRTVWQPIILYKGQEFSYSKLMAAPITNEQKSQLIVKWNRNNNTSYIAVYDWTIFGWKEIYSERNSKFFEQRDTFLDRTNITLYPATINTTDGLKWGYISKKGKFILSPIFHEADSFQENGLAIVKINNQAGLINKRGQYVVKPKYSTILPFTEGRAIVMDENVGFKVINEKGKELTAKAYSFIASYKENRAAFGDTDSEGRYLNGYLDPSGKVIIPLQYMNAFDFNEGKAIVQLKDSLYVLIGLNGERLQEFPYVFMGGNSEGLIPYKKTWNDKTGYVDEKGNVKIPPTFTNALPFKGERAVASVGENNYGLIDKKGNFLIPPKYNDVQIIGDNRVAVGIAKNKEQPYLGSTYAIADINGHFYTEFIYDSVREFIKGFSSVTKGQTTLFIDLNGKPVHWFPVIPGTGTLSLEEELIKAYVDNRLFYYDKAGNIVWKPNTLIPLNQKYVIYEKKYSPNKDYLVYYPQIEGMDNVIAQRNVNRRLKKDSNLKEIDSNEKLNYSYTGDYSVKFFQKNLLLLNLFGYEFPFGAAHGMPYKAYEHINLKSGKIYELKDLFKINSNYVKILSDIVGKKINDKPESYFPEAYKGIKEDQPFYVIKDALNIYFTPYEIAPYAMGFPTFTIPFKEIKSILDMEDEFWKSFH